MEHGLVPQCRDIMIRGFQMLLIVMMFNLAITVVAFLASIQFFWMRCPLDHYCFAVDIQLGGVLFGCAVCQKEGLLAPL
jgi:hypothetical protein